MSWRSWQTRSCRRWGVPLLRLHPEGDRPAPLQQYIALARIDRAAGAQHQRFTDKPRGELRHRMPVVVAAEDRGSVLRAFGHIGRHAAIVKTDAEGNRVEKLRKLRAKIGGSFGCRRFRGAGRKTAAAGEGNREQDRPVHHHCTRRIAEVVFR